MAYKEFTLTKRIEAFRGTGIGNMGLKFSTSEGYNVVFWGTEFKNTRNIENIAILKLPIKIGCNICIEPPNDIKSRFGVYWWVHENSEITILSD